MLDFLLSINWRQPLWVLLTLFPVFLWLLLVWQKNQQQNKFADKHLLPWLEVHTQKTPLNLIFSRNSAYFLAWLLFSLALAGPRIPDKHANNQNKISMDIMLVVDLSDSMQATDIKPSRIRRATLEIFDLLSMVKNARIGVIVYAGRAHLYVPLTSDLEALTFYLNDLDTLRLPTLGGNAPSAMRLANKELQAATQDNQQFIIWMTDGDLIANNKLKTELIELGNNHISTYILGLGTEEGAAIPLPDGSWLESEGQAVISKTNQKLLQQLSQIASKNHDTGSQKFISVSSNNSDWDTLYTQGILKSVALDQSKNTHQWKELYHWVLFPALLFLMMALFPMRIFTKTFTKQYLNSFFLAGLIVFLFAVINPPLLAAEFTDHSAVDNTYDYNIAQGIEAYRNNNFKKAKHYFIKSVLSASSNTDNNAGSNDKENTIQSRAIALHNLGNTLFQQGDYAAAAELFTDALRYAPKQQESAKNQTLSVELYIEMEKRRKRKMNQGNFAAPDDIAPLFDLPEQLPFMLSSKAIMLLKTSLPKLPKEELNRLLANRLDKFDLFKIDDKLASIKPQQKEQLDMQQARLYLMDQEEQVSTSTNPLWKRLFEVEEGFPGKLKKPKTIPGVQPW